jgi:protein-L-isoaspartate O-methyltransferase
VNVESYFKSIGVGRPKSDAIFAKNGRKRFGKAFEDLAFLIEARAHGADDDPYELKNGSLDLSLYVGEYHASNMWREFASWLVKENLPPPSEVLDLGSENGVLTCLCATLWPDAKVTGVQRSAAAVAAARELAKRLGLGNVCFERSDARQFLDANAGRFQVITATHVMQPGIAGALRYELEAPAGDAAYSRREHYVGLAVPSLAVAHCAAADGRRAVHDEYHTRHRRVGQCIFVEPQHRGHDCLRRRGKRDGTSASRGGKKQTSQFSSSSMCTKRTSRRCLTMSVHRGRPEVIGASSNRRD